MKIILASASPRRQELLHMIYPDFDILTADGEESAAFSTASEFVQTLAKQKGDQVISQHSASFSQEETTIVISADTIVYSNGCVLGKPADAQKAHQMLSDLSGKNHQVYTGLCISVLKGTDLVNQILADECTSVRVMSLTDEEINSYIQTGDPFDKAGGYGIQGLFGKYIEGIDGDYYNVVGLPVNRLYQELKKASLL